MTAKEYIKYYKDFINKFDKNIDRSRYLYTIYDNDYFKKTFTSNKEDFQRIYWEEILQRAHWSALSSLIRNLKWIRGVSDAIENNNLLAFTSNLRCLVESSGDNFLTLSTVPLTLADNFENISKSLRGENNALVTSQKLEEVLIHFSYARNISFQERNIQGVIPKYQNAKPATEYLKKLDHNIDKGPIAELYAILCQFTHPAAHSIQYLFNTDFNNERYKFSYSDNSDGEYIDRILNQFNDEVITSLECGFNSGILTLKALNFFDYDLIKTPYVDKINFDKMKTWGDIEIKMRT